MASPQAPGSVKVGGELGTVEAMASARGEVVEIPTEDLPFKAVISSDGKILRETYFATRRSAEAFLAMRLEELAKAERARDLSAKHSAQSGAGEGRLD